MSLREPWAQEGQGTGPGPAAGTALVPGPPFGPGNPSWLVTALSPLPLPLAGALPWAGEGRGGAVIAAEPLAQVRDGKGQWAR